MDGECAVHGMAELDLVGEYVFIALGAGIAMERGVCHRGLSFVVGDGVAVLRNAEAEVAGRGHEFEGDGFRGLAGAVVRDVRNRVGRREGRVRGNGDRGYGVIRVLCGAAGSGGIDGDGVGRLCRAGDGDIEDVFGVFRAAGGQAGLKTDGGQVVIFDGVGVLRRRAGGVARIRENFEDDAFIALGDGVIVDGQVNGSAVDGRREFEGQAVGRRHGQRQDRAGRHAVTQI